jgi:hypothetical protein
MSAPQGFNVTQTPNFSPEQMKFFTAMLGGLGGMGDVTKALTGLASGQGAAFAPMEERAKQDFSQMLGQAGSRFSQVGARGSSAFQQAVSGGASDLASKLAEQRSGLQMDAINKLLGFSGQVLGARPYETQLQEEDQGFDWGAAGESAIKMLPQILKLLGG